MDKSKSGHEVYHQQTYQSVKGNSYKLGIFIPFENGVPQPLEFWIKSEKKKTIFKSAGYTDSTWLKHNDDDTQHRFLDIVQNGLNLTKETSSFLISLWRSIHQKWQELEKEARKEVPKQPLQKKLKRITKQLK